MERDNWNYRNEPNRNREQNRDRDRNRVDEDMYRGAFRLDNSSDHRNFSTWNGFESNSHPDYNRDYNKNYNQDYNRNYNQGPTRGYDHDNYNMDSRYRDNDRPPRTSNRSDWNNRGYDEQDYNRGAQNHRSVHDRIVDNDPYGAGNFNAEYGPDRYGRGGGENYGNMAGSLSYGYDGTSNYDPDWDSHYDPQSGQRRSYHGNYTSRHPDFDRRDDNRERKNNSNTDTRNRY